MEAYLAGSDAERLAGVNEVLEPGVRWIVAARGGYGVGRLLDEIPWRKLVEREIGIVGFSDLTAILNPLAGHGRIQVHGPMVAAGLASPRNAQRLRSLLYGELVGSTLFRFPEESCCTGRSRHRVRLSAAI